MFIQHKIRPCFTWLPVLVLLLFLGLTGPSPALAHKVYLFAWVEGDTVLVDAYFSKSKRVMGGKIEVMDSTGQKLLEGTTDDKGRFSFKIPKKDDLFIYAEAGMGHKTEFLIKADELPDMDATPAAASAAPATDSAPQTAAQPAPDQKTTGEVKAPAIDEAQLKKIVEDAVEAKIKPLIRSIASLKEDQEPGLVEIFGGIGWILGLMGVALYFKGRKGGRD